MTEQPDETADTADTTDTSDEPQARFRHLVVGAGRATLAWRRGVNGELLYAASYCSPKDQFRRSMGRLIAEGRLRKIPAATMGCDDDLNLGMCMLLAADYHKCPGWARRAILGTQHPQLGTQHLQHLQLADDAAVAE